MVFQPLKTLAIKATECQVHYVNNTRTVINLEETIGRQVGRRMPAQDPLSVDDSNIQRVLGWHRSFPLLPAEVIH